MRLEVDDEALSEVEDARRHYASISTALGEEFVLAIDSAFSSIAAQPQLYASYSMRTRRLVLSRFPYAVVYRIRGDVIRVLAAYHQRRKPGYWRGR